MALLDISAQPFIDPDATLDYGWDWSETDWAVAGDTVASATVAVVAGTATVCATVGGTYGTSASGNVASNVVTVWVKGVTADASLRCRVTTTAGRVDDRTTVLLSRAR